MKKDPLMPAAKSKAEEHYILKRKAKAWGNSLCFILCRIFPIKKNLISVCAFEGKSGFCCNPKYIVQELHKQDPSLEFVWFVNPDVIEQKQFPDYIRKVPNTLWSRAYWLTRSKVWIDNYRKPYGTIKRKGQFYVNTWHGDMGFKPIGLWRAEKFSPMAYLVSKNDSDMIDAVLTESDYVKLIFGKGLLYDGEFWNYGQPRCDALYGDRTELYKAFREKHHLAEDVKLIMFAPTFRETATDGKRSVLAENVRIDIERVCNDMSARFGGEWMVCLRLHPQLSYLLSQSETTDEHIVDASLEDDMYEILAAMDAYITDYSSAAYDASYMGIPVFLYMDDIEKYENDRGSLMWDITTDTEKSVSNNQDMIPEYQLELPYPIAKNNDELESRILNFDQDAYMSKLNRLNQTVGLHFDGKASEIVASKIMKHVK